MRLERGVLAFQDTAWAAAVAARNHCATACLIRVAVA